MSHGLSGPEWSELWPGCRLLQRTEGQMVGIPHAQRIHTILSSGGKHATEYLCAEPGSQTADLNEADRIVAPPSAALH